MGPFFPPFFPTCMLCSMCGSYEGTQVAGGYVYCAKCYIKHVVKI